MTDLKLLPGQNSAKPEEKDSLRPFIIIGLMILIFGLGGFAYWGSTSKLASAAVAPGIVAVESRRKPVEHFEGGIVAEILVKEGDKVATDQVLFRVDKTQSQARREQLDLRKFALTIERDRLRAELDDAPVFSPILSEWSDIDVTVVTAMVGTQSQLFKERRSELRSSIDVFDSDIRQAEQDEIGFKAQLSARNEQLGFLKERLAGLRELKEKGFVSVVQLKDAEAETALISAEIAQIRASIKNSQERMRQFSQQKERSINQFKAGSAEQLQQVQNELTDVNQSLITAEDVETRTDIIAPIGGDVVGLAVNSIGSVITPGETLLEIVPEGDELVIDTFVLPQDIEVVRPGLPVKVRLTAYSFRSTPPVEGVLEQISADRVLDARTGTASFQGRVVINDGELSRIGVSLHAGMPAEVLILTGERTFMDYLLEPILKVINLSFLEQ